MEELMSLFLSAVRPCVLASSAALFVVGPLELGVHELKSNATTQRLNNLRILHLGIK
jgi:hypothetical protein